MPDPQRPQRTAARHAVLNRIKGSISTGYLKKSLLPRQTRAAQDEGRGLSGFNVGADVASKQTIKSWTLILLFQCPQYEPVILTSNL